MAPRGNVDDRRRSAPEGDPTRSRGEGHAGTRPWRARSPSVTLKRGRGQHRKYLPYVFTEQGVAMLSSVLRSERAVSVNIAIMRPFVRLRQLVASHADLERKLNALERKYDLQFKVVFDAIRALMEPEPRPTRPIGFRTEAPADKLRVRTPRVGSRATLSRPRPAAARSPA